MPAQQRRTFIVGVGCTAFEKPRNRIDYPDLGLEAAVKALLDAGITYDLVEQAYVGYCYGDSTCGQRALYRLGMTQIPVVNVNNNCATGSSALFLANQTVASGAADCAMALGFEKMEPGSLGSKYEDRANPLEKTMSMMGEVVGISFGPFAAQIFGNGGAEYCEKFGAKKEHIAAIAAKNHEHSTRNPYSQFKNSMTTEQVMNDKEVTEHLTRGMCCPTSDGGACTIVASESFVKKHNLWNQAIEIASLVMTTDSPKLFSEESMIELTGSDMTRRAAQLAFEKAGVGRDDVKVVELHDCFAANELLVYDALGLADKGKAHELVDRRDFTYGGKYVINPSGGLESKGHPLGATGLGMAFYLSTQLRGWSGPMQVPSLVPGSSEASKAKDGGYALLHNLGLGGACVVGLLKRPKEYEVGSKREDGRKRVGYNHACECRGLEDGMLEKVKAKEWSEFAAKL